MVLSCHFDYNKKKYTVAVVNFLIPLSKVIARPLRFFFQSEYRENIEPAKSKVLVKDSQYIK